MTLEITEHSDHLRDGAEIFETLCVGRVEGVSDWNTG